MFLALSVYVLFISLKQLGNGAQFLNTTCILLFPATNTATVIAPLTSIYESL